MSDNNNGPTSQEMEDDEIDRAIEYTEEALRGEHGEEAKLQEEARLAAYDKARRQRESIEIIRISSCDLPHHPAYVVKDLRQVRAMCELLDTEDTVWSQAQIDSIGRRAAQGEFNMITMCNRVTVAFKV